MLLQVIAGFWLGAGILATLIGSWKGLLVNLAGLLLLGWWGRATPEMLAALTGTGLAGILIFYLGARKISFTPLRFFTPVIVGLLVGLLARPLAGLLTLGGMELFRLAGGATRGWKVWLVYMLGLVAFTAALHVWLWFNIF